VSDINNIIDDKIIAMVVLMFLGLGTLIVGAYTGSNMILNNTTAIMTGIIGGICGIATGNKLSKDK